VTGKFLTADWRYVAMLNYVVDPEVLAPHVPRGTELETHGGRHFISLVGFLFLDTRLFGLPAFFHRNFEEVNLRFYVRRRVGEESRAGVVFIRELVSLPLVSEVARLAYNESYRTVPMQHRLVETNGRLQSVEYQFGRPRDRGWGYTRQRDGGTIEYRVEHPNWRVWSDARWELDGPLGEFYDAPFADILSGVPASASVSEGSAVAVHLPERIA